ncbi:DMT family transporter [Motiliproteus coralliicola]|uniref:DMT family transporter n=1 Tax=Motiliproteus coralliicola TaxID=2283196 RepID=A0A369WUH4_9GAMM|nr:DMT family transporter [Motiliproteus coralliicola]RDE25261.1 DMT family transporter [Motiliproteus coralliicola]
MQLTRRAKGLLITLTGVSLLIPDALSIRLAGLDSWNVVFWRSLLGGLVVMLVVLVTRRHEGPLKALRLSRLGLLLVALICTANIGFVMAMHHTKAANVLIVLALSPMFSALFDRLLFQLRLATRTWLAILSCLIGVTILVIDGLGGGTHLGNLIALGTAMLMGLEFSLMGQVQQRQIWPALSLAYLLSAAIAALMVSSITLEGANIPIVMAMGLLIVPFSFMLICLGPGYIPAPEVAIMLLLETVMGPLLVWWVLGEDPGRYALLGGAIVVTTLICHAITDLMQDRRERRAALKKGSAG